MLSHFSKPLSISHSSRFNRELLDHLDAYKHAIKNVLDTSSTQSPEEKKDIVRELDNQIDFIAKILELFNKGDRVQMFATFIDMMKSLKWTFQNPSHQKTLNKHSILFRIRTGTHILKNNEPNPRDFFHIPFNLRERVSNLRFNSPGIPCLYCSTDLNTAWMELDKPQLSPLKWLIKDGLNAAIFRTGIPMKVLDLSLFNFDEQSHQITERKFIPQYLLYPLKCSLHTKIHYPSEVSFRMEYLIPSLLMDWLFNQMNKNFEYFSGNKIDGIFYSSVKSPSPMESINVVLPAHFEEGEEHCKKLSSVFLSNPDNYNFIGSKEAFFKYIRFNPNNSTIEKIEHFLRQKMPSPQPMTFTP